MCVDFSVDVSDSPSGKLNRLAKGQGSGGRKASGRESPCVSGDVRATSESQDNGAAAQIFGVFKIVLNGVTVCVCACT